MRVVFISDTRYYIQIYATILFLNKTSPSIPLHTSLNKGLIYSSEQSSACYQLTTDEIRIGDALTVPDPM